MPQYLATLVKDTRGNDARQALAFIGRELVPGLEENGIRHFGTFLPLFGLSTNELYLVTFSENDQGQIHTLLEAANLTALESTLLAPTVRPVTHAQRSKAGVYVFRWFQVHLRDVDEIVHLSKQAWETFEDGFDTEVQGLFAQQDRTGETCRMLLITWYRDLSVWQASRQPPAEAREKFMQRHKLTIEARPIATRLAPAPD